MVLLVFRGFDFSVWGFVLFGVVCFPTFESRVSESFGFMVYRVWAGRLRPHFIFPILLWRAQCALIKNITASFSCSNPQFKEDSSMERYLGFFWERT